MLLFFTNLGMCMDGLNEKHNKVQKLKDFKEKIKLRSIRQVT